MEINKNFNILKKKIDKKKLLFFHKLAIGDLFWLPEGLAIKNKLKKILSKIRIINQCQEIETPTLFNGQLWTKTGHLNYFQNNMFLFGNIKSKNPNQILGFKPMNCPGAALVFKHKTRSYRDLPFRTYEFGKVFRKELSGTLNKLKRLIVMTQDDSHIFLTQNQLFNEVSIIVTSIVNLYKNTFEIDFKIYISTEPEKSAGNEQQWLLATKTLKDVLNKNELKFEISKKEGAFYGPKIDFAIIHDKKEWQCGTIQIDFNLCKNLNVTFNKNNKRYHPIVIHSALVGTIERFLGIILDIKQTIPKVLLDNRIKINILTENNKIDILQKKILDIIISTLEIKNINFDIEKINNNLNINFNIKNNTKKGYNILLTILKKSNNIYIINLFDKSKIYCPIKDLQNFLDLL